jgi:hypothetical protein
MDTLHGYIGKGGETFIGECPPILGFFRCGELGEEADREASGAAIHTRAAAA